MVNVTITLSFKTGHNLHFFKPRLANVSPQRGHGGGGRIEIRRSGSMHLAVIGTPVRAAVIVVAVVVVATPSHASKSCMTQAEARAQFATAHLYWHGAGHCWDATAPRHGLVHRIRPREHREAQADDEDTRKPEPKWRDAMSELLSDEASASAPVFRTVPQTVWAYDDSAAPAPLTTWLDRWVDIAQVVPVEILVRKAEPTEPLLTAGQKVEPLVTPTRVILIFLGLVFTIVVIELVYRSTIRER